jgi:putative ABC transport system substrate-binding protein
MRRRDFIIALCSAAATPAWALVARAQQRGSVRRIGVLMASVESDPEDQVCVKEFVQELRKLGWTDGQNVRIDYRWAGGNVVRAASYAAELVGLAPDAVLAQSAPMLKAMQQATRSVPIVFVRVSDPVDGGFVDNLAKPGGNVTGFTQFEYTITGKWLGVLKQIAPRVVRVAMIVGPENPLSFLYLREIKAVAPSFNVQLTEIVASDAAAIEHAISVFASEPNGGLIVLPSATALNYRAQIATLAALHKLPAIYPYRPSVMAGGLMSYGIDLNLQFRQAASYIDRILKGEKPGDLPIQRPTQFQLVINLKTAKALGLTIPDNLLAIADEVIE